MPTLTQYINSVEFLRFVAATFIVLMHMGIGEHSYKGMDLFFVTSGFIIFVTSSPKFGMGYNEGLLFYKRRIIRIVTFYWLLFLGLIALGVYKVNIDVTFFKNLFLVPGHRSFLEVTWSLSYELYFYALFAILIVFFERQWAMRLLLFSWLITFVLVLLQYTNYSIKRTSLNFFFGQNVWQFISGVLAGFCYQKMQLWESKNKTAWSLLLLGIGIGLFFSYASYYSTLSFLTAGFGSCIVLIGLSILEFEQKLKIPLGIVQLGNASYVAYLIHIPIIHFFSSSPQLKQTNQLLIIVGVWVLSVLIHRFVEQPLLVFLRQRFATKITKINT